MLPTVACSTGDVPGHKRKEEKGEREKGSKVGKEGNDFDRHKKWTDKYVWRQRLPGGLRQVLLQGFHDSHHYSERVHQYLTIYTCEGEEVGEMGIHLPGPAGKSKISFICAHVPGSLQTRN